MPGREFIWKVPMYVFDYLQILAGQLENGLISQADYIEKLRMHGMPVDAQPGDHIRIHLTKHTTVQVHCINN